MDLCRRCDVFAGAAGAGVARQPEGKTPEWLGSHCWVCHRSREEIRRDDHRAIGKAVEHSVPVPFTGEASVTIWLY